jgi:xanthine dehydrogenase accessory factor
MKALRQIFDQVLREPSRPWALATLVRTEGSTYRKPGAMLLVGEDGETTGVLSGGCLEEEIGRIGLKVMHEHQPVLTTFDTRRLYGCEGYLEIFIEPISAAGTKGNVLTAIAEKISRREICRTRTSYQAPSGFTELLPDKALIVEKPGVFVQTIPLPVRLLLFGSGPEIQPLRFFAAGLGWEIRDYSHPNDLEENFVIDDQTAAVVMTHNFGRDLAALDRLMPLRFPYLGLLGPKRRQAALLARFQDFRELDPEWIHTLHAPAGLDIGSETPEEIALSILAETSAVLARRKGGFLRDKATPIHSPEIFVKEA